MPIRTVNNEQDYSTFVNYKLRSRVDTLRSPKRQFAFSPGNLHSNLAMIEQTPSRRATITGLERGKRSWRSNQSELEKAEAGRHTRYHNSLHNLRSSGLSYNVYSNLRLIWLTLTPGQNRAQTRE